MSANPNLDSGGGGGDRERRRRDRRAETDREPVRDLDPPGTRPSDRADGRSTTPTDAELDPGRTSGGGRAGDVDVPADAGPTHRGPNRPGNRPPGRDTGVDFGSVLGGIERRGREFQETRRREGEQFGDTDWSFGLGDPDVDEVERFTDETLPDAVERGTRTAVAGPVRQVPDPLEEGIVGFTGLVANVPGDTLEAAEFLGEVKAGGPEAREAISKVPGGLAAGAVGTYDAARENPARLAGGIAGGAGIGYGVSRLARGDIPGRGRGSGVDAEPVPSGRADVGTGGRGSLYDAEAVDAARGVSGPSRTSLARGRVRRGASRAAEKGRSFMDELEVRGRPGAGLGGVEVRRRGGDAPDAPTDYDPGADLLDDSLTQAQDQLGGRPGRPDPGDYEATPPAYGAGRGDVIDPDAGVTLERGRGPADLADVEAPGVSGPDPAAGAGVGSVAGMMDRADRAQQSEVLAGDADLSRAIEDTSVGMLDDVGAVGDEMLDRLEAAGVGVGTGPGVRDDVRDTPVVDNFPIDDVDTGTGTDTDTTTITDTDTPPVTDTPAPPITDTPAPPIDPAPPADPGPPGFGGPPAGFSPPWRPFFGDDEGDNGRRRRKRDPMAGFDDEWTNPVAEAEDVMSGLLDGF